MRCAGTGKCHCCRLCLCQVDKLFQILNGYIVVNTHNEGHRAHITNRRKRGVLVVGQFLHQAFERCVGAVGTNENGVAIGSRFGYSVSTQHAIDASSVFNHDGLTQNFRHFLRKCSANLIGGAARCKGHDGLDGFIGVGLRLSLCGNQCNTQTQHHAEQTFFQTSHTRIFHSISNLTKHVYSITRLSSLALRHFPCASRAKERVTPPPKALCITKLSAPSWGKL